MSSICKGNWPHGKSKPASLQEDDAVLVEMDSGQHWGLRDVFLHAAIGRVEAQEQMEKLLLKCLKDVLSRVNVGVIVSGKEIKGWPLPAVAKVKNLKVELEYITDCDQKGGKRG